MKTLETKNLELKYTNKNLISTLSTQKEMLKTFKTKISKLEASNTIFNDYEKLNIKYEKLVHEHEELITQHNKVLEELSKLKEDLPEIKPDKNMNNDKVNNKGLFGRLWKRKNLDEKTVDEVEDKEKK